MAGNALVNYSTSPIQDRKAYAADLAMAQDMLPKGLLGRVLNPRTEQWEQAIVPGKVLLVLETGRMLGVDPMAAIQGINVIEGKASISPALMLAVVRKAGHKIEVKLTGSVEAGDIKATAILTRGDDGSVWEETWTVGRAIRAGLVDSYDPDGNGVFHVAAYGGKDGDIPKPWMNYTENLLRHRAVGDVCKFGATDALMGVHYVPEELGSIVSEEGTIESFSVGEFVALEDDAIARAKELVDKADMRKLYWKLQEEEIWTPRVETAFTAHLVTLTTDSDPKKPGAPGNTGIASIDTPTQPVTIPTESRPAQPTSAPVPVTTPEESKPVTEAHSETPRVEFVEEEPPADAYPPEDTHREISVDEADNRERSGWIAPGAALEAARADEATRERKPFNGSALA